MTNIDLFQLILEHSTSFTIPCVQNDEDGPPRLSNSLELQSTSEGTTSPASNHVVADCSSCCLSLPFLNRFRSPKWFLVFLSLAATVQGVCINGLVNVVITSIERRFHLQSTQSGIIASSYDIGSLVVMIPVNIFLLTILLTQSLFS